MKKIKTFESYTTHISDERNGFDLYQDIVDLVDSILNGYNVLYTDFGRKNKMGIYNLIKNNSAKEVVDILMGDEETFETSFGTKTKEGLKNMILNVYNYDKENKKKEFNL